MKLLLAVDGSPCSDLAVAEVGRRPWPAGTVVHVATVEAPVEPSLLRGSPTLFDEIIKQQRAASARRVFSGAIGAFLCHMAVMHVPVLQGVMETGPVSVTTWMVVVPLAVLMVPAIELHKLTWRRRYGTR